jgi:pimeloyl-ACP methyl ester carboxylesterase
LRRRLEGHADLDAVADAVEVLVADSAFASFDQLGSLRLPSLVVASHDQWDALHPRRTAEAYASALAAAQLVSEAPDHVPLAWRPRRIAQLVAQFARRVPFPTRSPTWSPCLD